MSRKSRFHNSFRVLSLATALAASVLALALPGRVSAGAYTYSTGTQRTVNAGVLLLNDSIAGNANPAGQGADNKDPYVFYILNQRIDIKPFGWNIVNPIAPTSVTSDVYQRWSNRTPAAQAPIYQLGQTLSPAMAAYWEVPLKTVGSDDLAKFDVLLLNLEKVPTFTAADTEKIRRFVDGGGTLWIEYSSNASSTPVPGLFFNLTFNNSGTGSAYLPSFIRSPLITAPYQLSEAELNTLGDKHIAGYYADDGNNKVPQDASGRLVFSTVVGNSGNNNLPVIAAAQYGAGEIVITTTGSANAINEYVGGVDVGVGANSGPFCGINLQIAPTADLKLVSDIIASSDSHLNEHQNSHQSGVDTGSLPSAVQTWNDNSNAGSANATGAVISGHIAYAVVGGNLTAYDLYPAEDLDGNGNPDDGAPDFNSGVPYDVLWRQPVGGLASAPTVAVDKKINGPAVFVEKADGTVVEYAGDTVGTQVGSYNDSPSSVSYGSANANQAAPSPTIYDGRVYVGRADGTLYVAPLQGAGVAYPVDPAIPVGTSGNAILAAPTVGIIPDNHASGKVPTNDIVALCTTNQGLFSVFLGARGELLRAAGANYNARLSSIMGAQLDPIVDSNGFSSYTVNPNGTRNDRGTAGTTNYSDATGLQLYADYDVNFASTPNTTNLTRTFVGASSSKILNGGAYTSLSVSTPALDRFGNIYYTVTDTATGSSTLVSVHDSPTIGGGHINWRFLLPTVSPGLDADNTNYDPLIGYQFLTTANGVKQPSAPVVDAQGNVYVLATGTTTAGTAILCFNGQGTITADALPTTGQVGGVNSVTVSQPLSGTTDEFGISPPTTVPSNQYTVNSAGHIEFTDFGQAASTKGTINRYPNLNEPYPLLISFGIGGGNGAATQNQNLRPLHTNLSWYSVSNTAAATSGLTLVGGTLYFMDNGGFLDSAPSDPTSAGFTITSKQVATTGTASLVTQIGNAGVGATTAVPSASNGAMVINGPGGVTAYTNQVTLVVDANRVLEMNSSGNAEWAVDSTSRISLEGDTKPIYNSGNGITPGTGQYVTTTLDLNRPSSVTELTANDYLVADTGNNRCVRFDRGGKVIWELTKFTDPNGRLKSGEPDTLNQPTSVQIHTETIGTQTIVRYLISDTGNDRIVEVDDIYDFTGNTQPQYHVLNWVSHTHDVQGRDYRYQSASYYASPVSGKYYVVALITNKRLGPFTYKTGGLTDAQYGQAAPGLLAPANQDAAGGTIVLLDYDPSHPYTPPGSGFGTNNQADGFIATTAVAGGISPIAISTIKTYLTAAGNFDLAGTLSATGTPRTLYIRNPRYMKVVTKLQPVTGGGTASVRHYLLADDNGAWDLDGDTFIAQWGFTQADYRNITTPISQDGVDLTTLASGTGQIPFFRTRIPFVPTSIQLTGSDLFGTIPVGRYLLTNSYSQGEAANNIGGFGNAYNTSTTTLPTTVALPGFGGEVFEIYAVTNGNNPELLETHETAVNGGPPNSPYSGPYSGHTLSRPVKDNTSPLSQPTFAYRLQF